MPVTLGPYEIRSELGRGAMAVVWRGYDPSLDREVALKEPRLPEGLDPAARAEYNSRFIREARAAARLNHPNIVTVHTADVHEGRAVIVMEIIAGETLGTLLQRGPLASPAALWILGQLLEAVGYAHSMGIVHRDIKPDNVFLTPDGRVKLADFGIASMGDAGTLTQAGTIMGTPGYMAPEQVLGVPADARADIFAVGVIAYEMLTGRNPFGASDGLPATTVMYKIVHESPPEISPSLLAMLPPGFIGALAVALAKDPAARFPNAEAFWEALSAGAAFTDPAAGLSRVRDKRGRRRWSICAGAGVAVAAAVIALVVLSQTGPTSSGKPAVSSGGSEPVASPSGLGLSSSSTTPSTSPPQLTAATSAVTSFQSTVVGQASTTLSSTVTSSVAPLNPVSSTTTSSRATTTTTAQKPSTTTTKKPTTTTAKPTTTTAKTTTTLALPAYANRIVQWSGDTKAQKTSWFVTPDLKRLAIPDTATYNALLDRAVTNAGAQPSALLSRLPEQSGMWAAAGDSMAFDRVLRRDMYLRSSDRRYILWLQGDGNFALNGPSGKAIWANGKSDTDYVIFQGDGNLVGYRADGSANWASNTAGKGGTFFVLQNDGNLVIYTASGKAIWASNTAGKT